MRFDILGPLEVSDGGEQLAIGGPQQQALLAVLLIHANRVVSVDRLVDCLWGDAPPATARSLLQGCVAGLRRALRVGRAERLLTRPPGYLLEVGPGEVDLDRFEHLVTAAARGEPAQVAAVLSEALECWRGPAFDGLPQEICRAEAARLDERRLTVLEDRVDADLALARHASLVPELRGHVQAHPFRERLWGQLMRALAGADRLADALAAYGELRRTLVDHLGVEPGEPLRRLHRELLAQPAPAAPGRRWRGPRPHLRVLVGRDRERAVAGGLVQSGRLVTVVGVGGVGKSSLALAVAGDHVFGDGVAVVPLAEVRGADEVGLAVGAVLGVTGTSLAEIEAELERHLTGQRLLLVLDNCEHVAAACAHLVRRLLAAATGLTVLATSRRPLGLAEEVVYTLGGLSAAPAAELFGRRAREALPGVALDAAQVARVCVRLDGLPLALELAAARLRALPLPELADRLEEGFGLLSARRVGPDPRHRTLTAAIEWSYRLLEPDEQRLLARLSVFRTGFTSAAAEAVCAAPPLDRDRVLPLLSTLVDHSVVQAYQDGGASGYRLLETVREFAARQLALLGEETIDHLFSYLLARFREIDGAPTLQDVALAGITSQPELGNLRPALAHGFANGRAVEAIDLTCRAFLHWMVRCAHHTEGQRWLHVSRRHLHECPPRLADEVRIATAVLRMDRGRWIDTRHLLRPFAGAEVDPRLHAEALSLLTVSELVTLNPAALDTSAGFFGRSHALADPDQVLLATYTRAYTLSTWGRYEEAARLCAQHETVADRAGASNLGRFLVARSQAAHGMGDHAAGHAFARRARHHFAAPGNYCHRSVLYRALVNGALCDGDAGEAAATAVDTLCALYPPSMTRAAEFTLLQAEANRRAGRPREAVTGLVTGLAEDTEDFSVLLRGVLITALLAKDTGDHDTAGELAGEWDRIRRGLGLPVPIGFEDPLGQVFGLNPAGGVPSETWDDKPIRVLIQHAAAWCTDRASR